MALCMGSARDVGRGTRYKGGGGGGGGEGMKGRDQK